MTIRIYSSITHITRNEDGEEEISLEYPLGLFELIGSMVRNRSFKVPSTKIETYVMTTHYGVNFREDIWTNKDTKQIPCYEKQEEIYKARKYIKNQKF